LVHSDVFLQFLQHLGVLWPLGVRNRVWFP
jgi:hypothetical protein